MEGEKGQERERGRERGVIIVLVRKRMLVACDGSATQDLHSISRNTFVPVSTLTYSNTFYHIITNGHRQSE